jgi:hypothetical protein
MYRIVHTGAGRDEERVEADAVLSPDDFRRIARDLIRPILHSRKVGYVAARPAHEGEVVVTRSETRNTAHTGDWVVTNLSPQRQPLLDAQGRLDTYVITAAKFPGLYEATGERGEHGAVHRAKGVVDAVRLPGGLDIAAPWGERQQVPSGYLILNGQEVYGSSAEAFRATYEPAA